MENPADATEQAKVVLYEKREGYAKITLNRPDVLNAMNHHVLRQMSAALSQAEADDEVKAVILTGAGRAFSAGGDLTEIAQRAPGGDQAGQAPEDDVSTPSVYLQIWRLSKPVIAAVAGFAVGGGCQLAAICDITIAAEDAKFGEPQIRHGFGPPVLITPWVVGLKKAKELMLTGELISAAEAQRIGMVNRVVPPEQLQEEAEKMAQRIAALPRPGIKLNKALINRTYELMGLLPSIHYNTEAVFADLFHQSITGEETKAKLRVLQERGWEAFIKERDALYRDDK